AFDRVAGPLPDPAAPDLDRVVRATGLGWISTGLRGHPVRNRGRIALLYFRSAPVAASGVHRPGDSSSLDLIDWQLWLFQLSHHSAFALAAGRCAAEPRVPPWMVAEANAGERRRCAHRGRPGFRGSRTGV